MEGERHLGAKNAAVATVPVGCVQYKLEEKVAYLATDKSQRPARSSPRAAQNRHTCTFHTRSIPYIQNKHTVMADGMFLREIRSGPRRIRHWEDKEKEAWLPPESFPAPEGEMGARDMEENWRGMEEQKDEEIKKEPKIREKKCNEDLAALVMGYAKHVETGAWEQARACLEQATAEPPAPHPSSVDAPKSARRGVVYALQEMGETLLSSLRKRLGWRLCIDKKARLAIVGHGGTSAAPDLLERQILSPLREAAYTVVTSGESVSSLELEGDGGALLLALGMEVEDRMAAFHGHDPTPRQNHFKHFDNAGPGSQPEETRVWEDRCRAALMLVARTPGLLSLHCCALSLQRLAVSSPSSLDCVLAALSLLEPSWEVDATLIELTARPSLGCGLQGWRMTPELLPPSGGCTKWIKPLTGTDNDPLAQLARDMWAQFHRACRVQVQSIPDPQGAQEEKGSRRLRMAGAAEVPLSPPIPKTLTASPLRPAPLLAQLLERMRTAWSKARATHEQKAAGLRLGRAGLALVRSGLGADEVNADVLGHLLPLCFALMEEYEQEELQVLGYVTWCFAAHKSRGPALSSFLPIQVQVFRRGLKVLVKRCVVLRLLLFCTTELLRLNLPSATRGERRDPTRDQRDADGDFRDAILQDLLAALTRASPSKDPRITFALLEGLHRLVPLYSQDYHLVRYLRALTQALMFVPLEEGDAAVRVAALRTILLVLAQCHVMIHQHAFETLAQVLRLYLLLVRRGEKQTEADHIVSSLCRDVANVIREKCPRHTLVNLESFIKTLREEGGYDTELDSIWPQNEIEMGT